MEPKKCYPDNNTSTVARGSSNLGATAHSATLHGASATCVPSGSCWSSVKAAPVGETSGSTHLRHLLLVFSRLLDGLCSVYRRLRCLEPQNCHPNNSTSTVAPGLSKLIATAHSATLHGASATSIGWAQKPWRACWRSKLADPTSAMRLGTRGLGLAQHGRCRF